MPEHDFRELLPPAVQDVLETMFFSETFGHCEPDPAVTEIKAYVSFSGAQSGTVEIRISERAARCLTASFLGESEDSLTENQVAQVVCELANMLCGSIVTRIASEGCFDLGTPNLVDGPAQEEINNAVQESFAIERGTLTVSLTACECA